MSRDVIAVDFDGQKLAVQPNSNERDGSGCFRGCRAYGCEATRCRDLVDAADVSGKKWFWK